MCIRDSDRRKTKTVNQDVVKEIGFMNYPCLLYTSGIMIAFVFHLPLSYFQRKLPKSIKGKTRNIDVYKRQADIQSIEKEIQSIDGVKQVRYSTPEEELELYIEEQGEEFAMFRGEENPLTGAFFITVKKADQIASITKQVQQVAGIRQAVYGGTSVSDMINMLNTVRFGGMIFIVLLALLALFLISNSIKMTIYARNREISIMRNVGATNGYIKVPFMLEGMIIGFIGSLIPCLITYFGYRYLFDVMGGQIFSNMFSLRCV